jgi:serine phosphatase RsbU (regulator of sigma subunit)
LAYSQIEEKNKHITDSINYAKRIQEAMLKDEDHTSEHLPPHFILFLPKDIVSGDFYWATEKEDYLYLAAADCTGHGVPGAFLTLLGTSFLNEITATDKIYSPAEILNLLRNKIVKELSNNGSNKDGMDISMIRLNLKTKEALWAGAYNSLWILKHQSNEITEIAANKQPVGYADNMKDFTDHYIQFKSGDQFYLFTDGYADQFGGPKVKK